MIAFLTGIMSFISMLIYLGLEFETARKNEYRNLSLTMTEHKVANAIFVTSVIIALALQSSNSDRAFYLIVVTIGTGGLNLFLGYQSYLVGRRGLYLLQSTIITSILFALAFLIQKL